MAHSEGVPRGFCAGVILIHTNEADSDHGPKWTAPNSTLGDKKRRDRAIPRLGIDCGSFRPIAYTGIDAKGTNALTGLRLRCNLYLGWRQIRRYPGLHHLVSRKTRKVRKDSRLCVKVKPNLASIFVQSLSKDILIAPAEKCVNCPF